MFSCTQGQRSFITVEKYWAYKHKTRLKIQQPVVKPCKGKNAALLYLKKTQKFFIKKEDIVFSNPQILSFGFTQCNVCPQGVMNRQDTYPPTKYSDPEFQQSLFNKSTWISDEEDSVSHTQETSCHHHDTWLGAQHLDVSILDLQLADSPTPLFHKLYQ